MHITMTSQMTGESNTMDLPITEAQVNLWKAGTLIQNAFPNLSTDEREFLISGTTKEEWEEAFGKAG